MKPSYKTLLINKEHPLSDNFVPSRLAVVNIPFICVKNEDKCKMHPKAAKAMKKMWKKAHDLGLEIYGISAYRSYSRQKEIFLESVKQKGMETTLLNIAPPGCSEHQSGLAIDVSSPACYFHLDESFGKTGEYLWLTKHAHRFGFIIRYPYGTRHITGYNPEPWHLRFVGKKAAFEIYSKRITLEEYLKIY